MKTTFVPTHGRNYHVIHETKTGAARSNCWTICGEHFISGTRSTHQPTCPSCVKLDNPLTLSSEDILFLRDALRLQPWRDAPKSAAFFRLRDCDFITVNAALTRRGRVLAEDFERGAVPMESVSGLMHAREPLRNGPRCHNGGTLIGTPDMTVSRYEKLRKLEESIVVTCLACIGK